MSKSSILGIALAALGSMSVQAACPAAVPGNTPEAVAANSQRLICLQNELAATTRLRQQELQLKQLTQSVQNLELQRRLDAIADMPVYVPPPPGN